MTSSGPYSKSHDFTHMSNIRDLRGCLPVKKECPTNIVGILKKYPCFSRFRYILEKSKLEDIYNADQADVTLFVPHDMELEKLPDAYFMNMDLSTARHIIRSHTLKYKITSDLLEDSPASYFWTMDPPNRLFITNMNGQTRINNSILVIQKDLLAGNGVIHVTDGFFEPYII